MTLQEAIAMINDGSNIRVTLDGTYVVAQYDGRNSIDDQYFDYTVNSMFPTTIGVYTEYGRGEQSCISIDVSSPFHVEIWRTADGEDWVKVNVDNYSDKVTDIQAGGWDWSGLMSYSEAVDYLAENGFTEYDPIYDRYESYEAWDDDVSCGGAYEYL